MQSLIGIVKFKATALLAAVYVINIMISGTLDIIHNENWLSGLVAVCVLHLAILNCGFRYVGTWDNQLHILWK